MAQRPKAARPAAAYSSTGTTPFAPRSLVHLRNLSISLLVLNSCECQNTLRFPENKLWPLVNPGPSCSKWYCPATRLQSFGAPGCCRFSGICKILLRTTCCQPVLSVCVFMSSAKSDKRNEDGNSGAMLVDLFIFFMDEAKAQDCQVK